jgi:thiamine phosphate synthase YjbQ (UPF0047 family)
VLGRPFPGVPGERGLTSARAFPTVARVSARPRHLQLALTPSKRFEAIDITRLVAREHGEVLREYPRALYCSFHTTAGYLDPRLAVRLRHGRDELRLFFKAFRALFPPNAPYWHDRIHLREELSAEQQQVEPRNGDSHLTFIGAGMRNCVTYSSSDGVPVFFVDLDGVNAGRPRRRETSVLAYSAEERVVRTSVRVPVSRHPIDSINLADPKLGLLDAIDDMLGRAGLETGRVDLALDPGERHAGLTVNEYETLLMQHDLAEVLRDCLRFAASKGRHMLDDPLAIPGKTLNYARYDVVRVINSLMEAFKLNESVVERLLAKVLAVPARRFLRSRKVSFLAAARGGEGRARLVRGTYQSPILVQWQAAEALSRTVEVSLVRIC